MSPETVGLLGIVALVVLLFARMWIGAAMALVGFLGYVYLGGIEHALSIQGTTPYTSVAFYTVTCVPLFILIRCLYSWVQSSPIRE